MFDNLLSSLLIISKAHNQTCHPDTLLAGLPLEQGVLNPSNFERAAKRAGFSSRIVTKSLKHLNHALFPAVLLLKENKSCVLLGVKDKTARVIYPELPDSEVEVSVEKLNQDYSGYTIYVRPEYVPESASENPFDSATKGHWFWSVIRQNSSLYRDTIAAAIIINLMAVATPLFVMNVYDRVVPNNAFSTLWVLSAGILIILAADLLLKLLRSWFVDLAASRTDIRLSSRLLHNVLGISLEHKPSSSSTLTSHLSSFEAVRSFVSSLTLTALADLPFLLLFIVIIGLINWVLVIPIVVGSVIILAYSWFNQARLRKLADIGMELSTKRSILLFDGLSNLETVKSFNIQGNIQSRWEQLTIVISNNAAKMRLLSATVTNGAAWVQQTVGVVIIITGVYLISEGELSQGGLIAAYLLSTRALAPVSQAAGLIAQFHQAATSMEALENLMKLPKEHLNSENKINRPLLKGEIEFRNVNFSYPGSDVLTLNQVNLKIKPGEKVAIIGKNGSGKTTLEKMILGLYAPQNGSILLDGIDLKQYEPRQLRKNIGYVPQDVSFLMDSLKQNITNGANISDEQVLEMVNQVGLTSLIQQHPEGLEMPVGERGSQLSGGQKQALAIARSLINDPSILIMDEPTASFDHSSEETIKRLLAEITKEKTFILVTHRTPLLSLVDRLIVIDQGKILADGKKETVMEALRQGHISGAKS